MTDFDRYTTGGSPAAAEQVPHVCPAGHQWAAAMWYETGGWFYEDDAAAYCPDCGAEACCSEVRPHGTDGATI